jgi:hypothetical protein
MCPPVRLAEKPSNSRDFEAMPVCIFERVKMGVVMEYTYWIFISQVKLLDEWRNGFL